MNIGTIESLWRYPVKSLLGESLDHLNVDARGVVGDRTYAVSNIEGKFGSGKNTRRFSRIDGLFSLSAETTANGVLIKFPDGVAIEGTEQSLNSKLSQAVGESVTLTKEAEISHFDDGAVHILTTESLLLLRELLPSSGIDARRFRANIVIDSKELDESLLGKTITVGETVLEITQKTQRCRMITLDQQNLKSRPEILKTVSNHFGLDFGVYARVISTGSISIGDNVELIQDAA